MEGNAPESLGACWKWIVLEGNYYKLCCGICMIIVFEKQEKQNYFKVNFGCCAIFLSLQHHSKPESWRPKLNKG